MTTIEKPPDVEWAVPSPRFAAQWGVAAHELVADGDRVAGFLFGPPDPALRARDGDAPALRLSARQVEVLRGMADGKSNAQIGRELYVTADTVKTHAVALFKRLGATDRAHAVALGFRKGVIV